MTANMCISFVWVDQKNRHVTVNTTVLFCLTTNNDGLSKERDFIIPMLY